MTTSSMCMEVKAVTEAMRWLEATAFKHAILATDSMSTLEKIRNGLFYADWESSLEKSRLKKMTWVFCPGHCGVIGNERADALEGAAEIRGSLTLDPATIMTLVCDSVRGDDTKGGVSYTLGRLEEKGVRRGAGGRSNLKGPARRRYNQLVMETISRATLKWTIQRRTEQIWVYPDCEDVDSSPK